jgi:hypothetical protein
VPLAALVDGHIGAQQNILHASDGFTVRIFDNNGKIGEQQPIDRTHLKNMITLVKADEEKLALEKEADEIVQIMIDNINRHLEEKEQKEGEKRLTQDSLPKDGKSSNNTSGTED